MRYKITGQVSIRNTESNDPMEITKDYEEIVDASDPEEAIEVSLSGFTEEEEPVWEKGYIVTVVS